MDVCVRAAGAGWGDVVLESVDQRTCVGLGRVDREPNDRNSVEKKGCRSVLSTILGVYIGFLTGVDQVSSLF